MMNLDFCPGMGFSRLRFCHGVLPEHVHLLPGHLDGVLPGHLDGGLPYI